MKEIDLLQELNSISKTHALQRDDIDQIMVEFAGRITRSLKIERMSVWLLNYEDREMTSLGEYDLRDDSFKKDSVIPMSICPEYFDALEKDRLLYVPDVLKSPITSGLNESYSIPNDVITLLDIPLRFEGEMIGVMCFEKTGSVIKEFDDKERFFASAISLVFSSNLEARKRRALQSNLDQELREKETLLKEIHHRVKNNLAVVSSLINMQSSKAKDEYHRQLLDDCRGKIQSIADLHNVVYQNNSFANVSVQTYFTNLLHEIMGFYDSTATSLTHEQNIDDFELSIEHLIPLGLIVNEVVTNCYKHAFQNKSEGHIVFDLTKDGNRVFLAIQDNGSGIGNEDVATGSLGMEIIHDLAEQIDARFSYEGGKGTIFRLEMEVNE